MDRRMLGKVELYPKGDVVAGSVGTWRLVFKVGKVGIDEGGTIIITRRTVCDSDIPQLEDPSKPGYVTVTTTGEAKLRVRYEGRYHIRPWRGSLVIDVYDGFLKEGDEIVVTYGDRRGGCPGFRMQTFREREHTFRVLVDSFGTGKFYEVEVSPTLKIIGGPPDIVEVVAPSKIVAGEAFRILVRVLDSWGNPSENYRGTVEFESTDAEARLPLRYRFKPEDHGCKWFDGVVLKSPGTHVITVKADDGMEAASNPIMCCREEPPLKLFWGDLHGQTRMTVGTGTVEEYFAFARDVAALDFCSWQGNDFQVTREGWEEVKRMVKSFHKPGRFITFLGYEWSGLTPEGGDHNIYFIRDDEQIHRSSHWLIEDKSDEDTDRYPITELWRTFRGHGGVMAIPHVGGRYANLDLYDPEFIPLIEVHSCHGTFEWFLEEALKKGLKVGFVAGSDDHTGRPGLAYPTQRISREIASFDVKGGLTAVYAEELTRESLWEAMWKRRCYATTGERIILWVEADGHQMGEEYETGSPPKVFVMVYGTGPLMEVELKRGTETIYRHPVSKPRGSSDRRILVEWSGVRSKGRAHRVNWDGELHLSAGRILSVEEFAFDKPQEGAWRFSNQIVKWSSTTSGDVDGVILEIDAPEDAKVTFSTKPITFTFRVGDVTHEPLSVDAGGVNLKVRVWEVSANGGPTRTEFKYVDEDVKAGVNPYWVRVMQRDGSMAWSSPIFVRYEP